MNTKTFTSLNQLRTAQLQTLPLCSCLNIYISRKIRLCVVDLEGQFQTTLQVKVINFFLKIQVYQAHAMPKMLKSWSHVFCIKSQLKYFNSLEQQCQWIWQFLQRTECNRSEFSDKKKWYFWPLGCTEVCFASFLSSGFTTMAVMNPPEMKLEKGTSV